MGRSTNQRVLFISMLAVVALVAAGCSSSSSSSSSSAAATTSASSDGVKYATAQLQKYSGVPTFTAPGPAFDVSKLKGKSMFVIPAASNDFDNTIEAQMKTIAAKYGVKYTTYTNQGSPAEWVAGLNAGLSQHPSLIVLNTALNPAQVSAQMKSAKAAGIPVLATHFFDQDYSKTLGTSCGGTSDLCAAGLTATVNAPFNAATKLEADKVIADSNGKGHVLIITANDAAPTAGMVTAAQQEFSQYCPACKVTVQNISIADWATKIQPQVQTALTVDPDLHYIMPLFDYGASFAASGINAAGKQSTTKIVSYNGTQNVLAMLQKGDMVALDVGEPLNWLGYAFMDQAFRVMAGVPTVQENTPIRAFDKSNIGDTGTPPDVSKGYGDTYIQGYEQLWKTS